LINTSIRLFSKKAIFYGVWIVFKLSIKNGEQFFVSLKSNLKPTYIMRILVFSLFLCFNFFTSQAQSNSKFSDASLLVNGKECDKCSLEFTREELKKINLTTNNEDVKISGFKLKVAGSATISVKGHKFSPKIFKTLNRASIGDRIQIFGVDTNKGVIKTTVIVKLRK